MIKNVIIQAGGKGSRMGYLTNNRPKCLISLYGTNLLKTVAAAFPGARLYIIGDYKFEALKGYLESVDPGFEFTLIKSKGIGTNAGINEALEFIPENERIAVSWSDLYYQSVLKLPEPSGNYVCVSNTEKCRYRFEDGRFIESLSSKNGVIGLFIFENKKILGKVPDSGEFVKFLASTEIKMESLTIDSIVEIGTLEKYIEFKSRFSNSRFFNSVIIENDKVTKTYSDPEFKKLIELEVEWYKFMNQRNYDGVPKIFTYEPLQMERIDGMHPYQMGNFKENEKIEIVKNIMEKLKQIHSLDKTSKKNEDLYDVYVEKTLKRIEPATMILKNKSDMKFKINGKRVQFLSKDSREIMNEMFKKLTPINYFYPIHGDPTFSNTIVTKNGDIKFIDPRGYFGKTKIFGDSRYDFAKLYYSAVGNYDQFNNGNFKLELNLPEVNIDIVSSKFEITDDFFKDTFKDIYKDIKILHSMIWLSLSGYVLNDYDSILASYFLGLYYLECALNEY